MGPINDFGSLFDSKLKFDRHVDHILNGGNFVIRAHHSRLFLTYVEQCSVHLNSYLNSYFLYTLLTVNIDCPEVLRRLSFFNRTRTTRSENIFHSSVRVTNYDSNTPSVFER